MKKIVLFSLLTNCMIFAQENQNTFKNYFSERKGRLFLNFGTEIRITPYYNEKDFVLNQNNFIPVNDNEQNSGVAFYYNLNYFVTENLSFGFANTFRNDILFRKADFSSFPQFKISKPEKTIFIDYHLFSDYYIKLSPNSKLFLRLGISYLNTNSDYILTESIYQNGVWIGNTASDRDFSFASSNYGLGFKKNRFDFMIGAYTSKNSPYSSARYTIPYIKINYTLFKL